MAKAATDAILEKFKSGTWKVCSKYGVNFYRTGTFFDFPSPDASFLDDANSLRVSFEFKPPTETKRGILTGLGQAIAYLQRSNVAYLVIPKVVDNFNMEDYLKTVFEKTIKNKIPVGLICYDVDNPSNVALTVDIPKSLRLSKAVPIDKNNNSRYWAKHQDLPLPLFDLILHYYYKQRIEPDSNIVDPYAQCWVEHMVSKETIKDFMPRPVTDLKGNPIKTMSGNKDVTYNEDLIIRMKKAKATDVQIRSALQNACATTKPKAYKGTWDNNYKKVKRYIVAFMKQINMIDNSGQITERGIKLHQVSLINGVDSKLYRDYFTKEVLITGSHFDLIIDFDRMYRSKNPSTSLQSFLRDMESTYETSGNIKRNPGRKADEKNSKPFLEHERTLWKYLDLVNDEYVVDWKRIIEVCTLPEL